MPTQTWGDLYTGNDRDRVEAGTYRVRVEAARDAPSDKTLFLDLRVLDGPAVDKLVQVNLFVPRPGEPASFYFAKKVAGFEATPEVIEAYRAAGRAEDFSKMRRVIGDNIVNQVVLAEIGVQGGEAGEAFAGSNELAGTRPDAAEQQTLETPPPTPTPEPEPAPPSEEAPPAPPAPPAPAPPAPAPPAPGNGVGEKEDIEALRAKLAAAEADAKKDAVADASAAVGGEEPF